MLRAQPSGDVVLVGKRFSAPVHTGPGAHSASYTVLDYSWGVKRLGRGDTTHPHVQSRLKQITAVPLLPPLGLHGIAPFCLLMGVSCQNIHNAS
jgi:hypothetical protein